MTVQRQFESVVTEISQDALVGSSSENGPTVIPFERHRHNVHQELGTQATLWWRKDSYQVVEQTLAGCQWLPCAHPRGEAAAVAGPRPGDGGSQ